MPSECILVLVAFPCPFAPGKTFYHRVCSALTNTLPLLFMAASHLMSTAAGGMAQGPPSGGGPSLTTVDLEATEKKVIGLLEMAGKSAELLASGEAANAETAAVLSQDFLKMAKVSLGRGANRRGAVWTGEGRERPVAVPLGLCSCVSLAVLHLPHAGMPL